MLIQLYIAKGPLNMLFWNKHIQIVACYSATFIQIQNIGLYVAFTQSDVIVVLEKQCTTDGTSVCIQSICTWL